ncbi:MAG TPA: hypothetical protein VK640_07870 [Actinomycetes bacterium]|nr:hypothetical protein [Actinomycetes bacterium]
MGARTDAWGLPVTGDADAVALWDAAVDDYLAFDGPDRVVALVEQAPDLAVGHALLALAAMDGEAEADADVEIAQAERLAADASEREHAFVAAMKESLGQPMWALDRVWGPYLADHPTDLLARFTLMFAVLFAFREDGGAEAQRLVREGRRLNGAHPLVQSMLAMAAQERGELDEAQAYAAEVLADRPGYIPAGHVTAHVHFERGDHQDGLAWLTRWVRDQVRPGGPYLPHLSWHAGLHELALDDRAAVLRRLVELAGPDGDENWYLSNGASYAWRLKLAGLVPAGEDPSGGLLGERAGAVAESPPFLFVGWHAALGLACAGDVPGLRAMARRFEDATGDEVAPGGPEVLPPLAGALADLLEDRPGPAADAVARVTAHGKRLGGSRAQREVLEDTLLAALVRAGRTEQAGSLLQERLDRRPSASDSVRLAALQLPLARSSPDPSATSLPG